jgi:thiol-disulfide isomerase/thioredoxin
METHMKRFGLALAIVLACGSMNVLAQDAAAPKQPEGEKAQEKKPEVKKLAAGDMAPALSIEKWVKGEPITGFEKGRTYVVEFWATWCGPCIASMPHLTELQKQYKDKGLTIIGVTSQDPNNTLEAVEEMVKDKGDGMGYTVAWDKDRDTSGAFMKASGQRGIPCSFVVDGQGKIAYIGHPMFLDPVLEKVVAGKWDIEKDNAELNTARDEMYKLYEMEGDPSDPEVAKEMVTNITAFEGKYPYLSSMLQDMKYQMQLAAGDTAGASKTGNALFETAKKHADSQALNALAWGLVDPEGEVKNPDLDLAMKAAIEANRLTGEKDAAILDTLARVHWLKGDKAKAIELQTKAVELAPEQLKEDLKAVLDEYKAAEKK